MRRFANSKFFVALVYINFCYFALALPALFVVVFRHFFLAQGFFLQKLFWAAAHFLFGPSLLSLWLTIPVILINLPIKQVDLNENICEKYGAARVERFQKWYDVYFLLFFLVMALGTFFISASAGLNLAD
ncbi:hypothetical protein [Flaviaesturariibacter amylovorans]|uniref:hypothetical protein n=1 Tax=Flaviaesturariibacter amylovorans TaxID=1084520 RepID=UPI0031E6B039